MVTVWYVIGCIVVSWLLGVGMTYFFLRTNRGSKEIEQSSTKQTRPLNKFDAYSDKELQLQRDEAARQVRSYLKHGYNANKKIEYLREVDDEFEARNNAKLAAESDRRTQHEREIAIFDTVYGEVLKNADKKELN